MEKPEFILLRLPHQMWPTILPEEQLVSLFRKKWWCKMCGDEVKFVTKDILKKVRVDTGLF